MTRRRREVDDATVRRYGTSHGNEHWRIVVVDGMRRGVALSHVATERRFATRDDAIAALREWRGSVLALQRLPLPGEVETISRALGRRAHDLSALNENLEDIAAVLELADEYVGVSNTNMHIRAGLGKTARVLVPFPPEFRWMHAGRESPWFRGFRLYRQDPARAWSVALETLRLDISS